VTIPTRSTIRLGWTVSGARIPTRFVSLAEKKLTTPRGVAVLTEMVPTPSDSPGPGVPTTKMDWDKNDDGKNDDFGYALCQVQVGARNDIFHQGVMALSISLDGPSWLGKDGS